MIIVFLFFNGFDFWAAVEKKIYSGHFIYPLNFPAIKQLSTLKRPYLHVLLIEAGESNCSICFAH